MTKMRLKFLKNADVDFCHLIKKIKTRGFPVRKSMIYYYSSLRDLNVFCGNYPLASGTIIPKKEISYSKGRYQVYKLSLLMLLLFTKLTIKIRLTQTTSPGADNPRSDPSETCSKKRRANERKIQEVIDIVFRWRKLYVGYTDQTTGKLVKLPLGEAANKVGVSLKTLNDYLFQLKLIYCKTRLSSLIFFFLSASHRIGRELGFNYNEHFNEKIGVLRAFVKRRRIERNSIKQIVKSFPEICK